MDTWYEVSRWNPGAIKPVQVEKATDKTLLIVNGKSKTRADIVTKYSTYYPTLDAAVRAARYMYERTISGAQSTIERAQADLAKLAAEYPAEYAGKQEAA